MSLERELIDVDDCVLLVIDVQDRFLEKFAESEQEILMNRIGWVIDVAVRLQVPVVAMAEDIPQMGSVTPSIAKKLPPDTHVFNKMIFGLAASSEIMAALKDTGRNTTILVGFETDVCVAHSALGLLQQDYKVTVVSDACASPGSTTASRVSTTASHGSGNASPGSGNASPGYAHQIGLERMRQAGVVISSVKSLFYEWVRTVEGCEAFLQKYGDEIGIPQGIVM